MQLILFSIRRTKNLLQKLFDDNPLANKHLCIIIYRFKPKEVLTHMPPFFLRAPCYSLTSIGSPRRTSTSYNVMVTSPCGMWKVWVSGHHRSTKAVISLWSISLLKVLRSPSKPSPLMMSLTRSSTIGSRLVNFSLQLRQVRDLGSYTEQNHGLLYDSRCVYILWIKWGTIRRILFRTTQMVLVLCFTCPFQISFD